MCRNLREIVKGGALGSIDLLSSIAEAARFTSLVQQNVPPDIAAKAVDHPEWVNGIGGDVSKNTLSSNPANSKTLGS